MTAFRKKMFWPLTPPKGFEGVFMDILCGCIVLYDSFPYIWHTTWLLSEKKNIFWPFDPIWGLMAYVRTEYVLTWCLCSIPFNLICSIATLRKHILTFDPTQGVEGVCKNRIWACVVLYAPFPLIWYATWLYSENNRLTFWPHLGAGVCVRIDYVLAWGPTFHAF